jgi:hypothetical protein
MNILFIHYVMLDKFLILIICALLTTLKDCHQFYLEPSNQQDPASSGAESDQTDDIGVNSNKANDFGANYDKANDFGANSDKASYFGANSDPADDLGANSDPVDDHGANSDAVNDLGANSDLVNDFNAISNPADNLGANSVGSTMESALPADPVYMEVALDVFKSNYCVCVDFKCYLDSHNNNNI